MFGTTTADSDDDGGDAPEPDADEGAWISLGFIAHHLLSLRARVSLMFRRAPPLAPAADDSPVPHRRIEPRLVVDAAAPAERPVEPAAGADDDEDDIEPAPRAKRLPRAPAKPARRSADGYDLAVAQSSVGAARQ